MSNFNIFDKAHVQKLLEPFAPGMTPHITLIKYEALTPDCFLLLFRTTDNQGGDHFFVSLETDYIDSITGAECTVEDWHGKVIRFWRPNDKQEANETIDELKDFQAPTAEPYFAMLAEVERPTHKGYWAEAITIMPGDNIGEKIKSYSTKEQQNIRNVLTNVLQHKTDVSASFLESFETKRQNTVVNDINQTDIAVSLYVQPDGKVECFYNYVHPTIGSKGKGK